MFRAKILISAQVAVAGGLDVAKPGFRKARERGSRFAFIVPGLPALIGVPEEVRASLPPSLLKS
jgi:hypothetical protein